MGDHRGSPDADHFTTFLTSYSWLTKLIQTPLQLPCDRSFISIFATIQKHLDLHCNGNYNTFHTRNDQKEHFIALNTCVYHSNKFPAYIPLMLFDYKSGQDICTYKWCNPIHFVRTKWIGFASQSKWIIWETFNRRQNFTIMITAKFKYSRWTHGNWNTSKTSGNDYRTSWKPYWILGWIVSHEFQSGLLDLFCEWWWIDCCVLWTRATINIIVEAN